MNYSEFKSALHIFGFNEHDRPTVAMVKQRHRTLVKNHHPDLAGDKNLLSMQKINTAATLITEYLKNYRFSFSEEEFYLQNPDELLRVQFSYDPSK